MGHTCDLLFKEIYHEGGREKKRDGLGKMSRKRERWMGSQQKMGSGKC